ncbi:hypothetical protein FCM35_KLT00657 [Carex littledalei]|uniref:Uncharacterized protein n=1 Tax=Carex littledalei TaxID=544730 RepID=A0A833S273_9POAL|nr:hypothetical protein FCM35_KLT00657 [Carex littledalei]
MKGFKAEEGEKGLEVVDLTAALLLCLATESVFYQRRRKRRVGAIGKEKEKEEKDTAWGRREEKRVICIGKKESAFGAQ